MALSRRQLLKRLSVGGLSAGLGTAALSPLMATLSARAAAGGMLPNGKPPQRFVFVVKSSGLDRQNLGASGIGDKDLERDAKRDRTHVETWDDQSLPEVCEALEPIKNRVTVIQGLSGDNLTGNHTAGFGLLSCYNSERVALAPTVDYLLGKHLSTGPYPMFAMAMNGSLLGQNTPPEDGYCYPNISAMGESQAIPFQASPEKAFMNLFGSAVLPPDEAKRNISVQKNLMDFLAADAQRIQKQLKGDELDRFASYTGAFDLLRARESEKVSLTDRTKRFAPEFTDQYKSEVETVRQECQFDIATAALIIGMTNVVTLRPDTLGTVYSGLGYKAGLHAIGHGGESGNGVESKAARKQIDQHHLSLIADMAKRLAAIPEGDGNMLDNTLIVYTSCAGGSHHGGLKDWPVVLVGGAQNRLKMGQYIQLPSYQNSGHRTLGNLHLSLLQSAGLPSGDYFGQPDPQLQDIRPMGPIDELMV